MFTFVKNDVVYYEFIRQTRTHPENTSGFNEQVEITPNQQLVYMSKHKDDYFICLLNDEPVGWIGVVDNEIRLCTHQSYKSKGVGKFMLNNMMKITPEAFARVIKDNIHSQNLFVKCGFTVFKQDMKYYYYKLEN